MARLITVKVIPKSSRQEVVALGEAEFRVYVHTAPDKGRANAAVIALLAKHFDLPKTAITLKSGSNSHHKQFLLA